VHTESAVTGHPDWPEARGVDDLTDDSVLPRQGLTGFSVDEF
jgi:hypothetical protein